MEELNRIKVMLVEKKRTSRWLAEQLGKFNANELKRADHEVHDIADGRYDGRIQKYQQGLSR